jgi:hypothetical protein
MFYTAGTLPVYDIRCELFVYNNQKISTGIIEIDNIASTNSAIGYGYSNTMPSGTTVDNTIIETAANTILDFSETNPFGSF